METTDCSSPLVEASGHATIHVHGFSTSRSSPPSPDRGHVPPRPSYSHSCLASTHRCTPRRPLFLFTGVSPSHSCWSPSTFPNPLLLLVASITHDAGTNIRRGRASVDPTRPPTFGSHGHDVGQGIPLAVSCALGPVPLALCRPDGQPPSCIAPSATRLARRAP